MLAADGLCCIVDEDSNQRVLTIYLAAKGHLEMLTWTQLAKRPDIFNALPSHQACYVGLKLGYDEGLVNRLVPDIGGAQATKSVYCLHERDRHGNLHYKNRFNAYRFVDSPLALAQKKIITAFDAGQAFYIGLLAGVEVREEISVYHEHCPLDG